MNKNKKWPKTIDEAVRILIDEMSEEDQEAIRNASFEDIIFQHFNLGMYIRNRFGLWKGNTELFKDCGLDFPEADTASWIIAERLYQTVNPGMFEDIQKTET